MSLRLRWLPVILILSAPFALPVRAETDKRHPPEGVISDAWYAALLGGKKAGHMHAVLERRGDRVVSSNEMALAVKRGTVVLDITIESRTEESLDGTPITYASVMNLGSQTSMNVRAAFDGRKVTVTAEQFGVPSTNEYTLSRQPMLAWAGYLEQQRRGLKPGTKYTLATYEPTVKPADVLLAHVEVVGPEAIDLLGRKTEATKLNTVIEGLSVEQASWVDRDGEILKVVMPIAMLDFEMIRCDKTFALQDKEPPEMFVQSMVPIGRPLDRDNLKLLKLRLSVPDGEFPDLPETAMQKVRRIDRRSVELTITRIDHSRLQSVKPGRATGEAADCLRPNVYMDFKDPAVSKMAANAVQGARTLYEKVDRLRKYVSQEITEKSLDVGLATASEVARSREGDCSEHAILLAALGRGNKIPARVVAGLVYVSDFLGQSDAFGYHMWTQYYIGGKWVDVDAAFRETEVDPTHVALSVMSLNDEGFFDSAFAFIPLMGRLKIEVLEATPN